MNTPGIDPEVTPRDPLAILYATDRYPPIPRNLSGMENTPEFQQALELAKNGGGGTWTFHTTLGHIVTKLLEMNLRVTLPDGDVLPLFQAVDEINNFLRITPVQYGNTPNVHALDHLFWCLYKDKVREYERIILDPQVETMQVFFDQNVWWMVTDEDTIDTLLQEIDELATMGIAWVDAKVCTDVKEWIIMNTLWKRKSLNDWYSLTQAERDNYLVGQLDKKKYSMYFADCVVEMPSRRSPNAVSRQLDEINRRIRALYIVDREIEEIVGTWDHSRFRNTRYV